MSTTLFSKLPITLARFTKTVLHLGWEIAKPIPDGVAFSFSTEEFGASRAHVRQSGDYIEIVVYGYVGNFLEGCFNTPDDHEFEICEMLHQIDRENASVFAQVV